MGSESHASPGGGRMYENLRDLITTVDHLRDVGLQQFVNLPRIVVTGTQSAGKSSVLESVVGLDCLPRGDGVVTRRPLELRLVHLSSTEYGPDEAWAVFPDLPDQKFTDFSMVKQKIDELTDQVAGGNKGIVDKPIVMTVYAVSCPDLTVIDLPGITRVPVRDSDQKEDIEKVTRDMTLRYIKDPRTIILAVMPANQDLTTSDALQMARTVDPQGLRTIGVITKIDIMDRGTDAVRMLKGEDVPLRLGYVGLKLRSQADIAEGKKVRAACRDEDEWFKEHAKYGKLPPGLTGTLTLVDKLTLVLCHHIRQFLPQIKREVSERIRKCEDRIEEIGDGVPAGNADRVQMMWAMISAYADMFSNTIRGKYDKRLTLFMQETKETQSGGAKIRGVFNDFLNVYAQDNVSSLMNDQEIDQAIKMHEGDSLPGFPSPDTFEFLILPHLRKIQEPSMECLNEVSQILEQLCSKIAKVVFRRFPRLGEVVLEMTKGILAREQQTTSKVVENIVHYETGYLFTNDDSYLGSHGSMSSMYQNSSDGVAPPPPAPGQSGDGVNNAFGAPPPPPPQQQQHGANTFVREVRGRLNSYFKLVIRNTRDGVPKAIGFFLVRKMQDTLQFELYNQLTSADRMSELLGEPPHIVEERRSLSAELQILRGASSVLQKDIASNLSVEDALSNVQMSRPAAPPPQPAQRQPTPQNPAAVPPGGYAPPRQPQPANPPAPAQSFPQTAAPNNMFASAPLPQSRTQQQQPRKGLFD